MSLTKEIAERENRRTTANYMEFHLFKEGTFLRAYEWSAFLGCRYLHEFKVNKRAFKGIEALLFPNDSAEHLCSTLNSFLGLLSHNSSYRIRCRLFGQLPFVRRYGYFQKWMLKYVVYPKKCYR